jgi:hypothetical protein
MFDNFSKKITKIFDQISGKKFISQDDLGEPQWPEQTMDELIQEVFGNNIIDSEDHPYIRQIQGRI